MGIEIERKFISNVNIKTFLEQINAELLSVLEITQNYIAVGEEEVRSRAVKTPEKIEYFLTYKKGKGLQREELEVPIMEETFIQLNSTYRPIIKTRTKYKLNDLILEIDKYKDFDFNTVEIEFSTVEDAESFKPFDWFEQEVTSNKAFKNQHLWKKLNNL